MVTRASAAPLGAVPRRGVRRPPGAPVSFDRSRLRSAAAIQRRFYVTSAMLLSVVAFGVFAYFYQLRYGLATTGWRRLLGRAW